DDPATVPRLISSEKPDCGSIFETVPARPFATQMDPAPTASPVGLAPSPIVFTFRDFWSIRESVLSSSLRVHTAFSPATTRTGFVPTPIDPTTPFVLGSMIATALAGTVRTVVLPGRLWPRAKMGTAIAAATTPARAG